MMHLYINDRSVSAKKRHFCKRPSKKHWPNCLHRWCPICPGCVLQSAVQNHRGSPTHTWAIETTKFKKTKNFEKKSPQMVVTCQDMSGRHVLQARMRGSWSTNCSVKSLILGEHLSFAREIATEQRSLEDISSLPCHDAFSKSRNSAESWATWRSGGVLQVLKSRNKSKGLKRIKKD